MTVRVNINGQVYDDSEPSFLTTGTDKVYDRLRHCWTSWASLKARAKAIDYVFPDGEVGVPSGKWAAANMPNQIFRAGFGEQAPPSPDKTVEPDAPKPASARKTSRRKRK